MGADRLRAHQLGETVMVQAAILEKLEQLPESLQTEVLHYIEFLAEKYAKDTPTQAPQKKQKAGLLKGKIQIIEDVEKAVEPESEKKKRGGLGILKGKIWMADDFDQPLEDMKEYM
jgi:hypothetical protein